MRLPGFATTCLGLVVLSAQVCAADLSTKADALKVITDSAKEICDNISFIGGSQQVSLTGAGGAKVKNLIKYLADLGIEGALSIDTEEYTGLLLSDLGILAKNNPELLDQSQCRLTVFRELKDDVMPVD